MGLGTWTGTFTSESFAGPGIYQAKNGVRCFVNMRTNPGAVTIDAPASPADHTSFLIEWDNPTKATLSFNAAADFVVPTTVEFETGSALNIAFRRGSVAFTFIGGRWELFNWSLYGISLSTNFAISWIGQNTNGLCVVTGEHNGIEVERTALGFYTVRLRPGTLASATMVLKAPFATGLPAETSPELRDEDVGMAVADEILINSGLRNKNGQFSDDDLLQDPANFMAIIGQQFP